MWPCAGVLCAPNPAAACVSARLCALSFAERGRWPAARRLLGSVRASEWQHGSQHLAAGREAAGKGAAWGRGCPGWCSWRARGRGRLGLLGVACSGGLAGRWCSGPQAVGAVGLLWWGPLGLGGQLAEAPGQRVGLAGAASQGETGGPAPKKEAHAGPMQELVSSQAKQPSVRCLADKVWPGVQLKRHAGQPLCMWTGLYRALGATPAGGGLAAPPIWMLVKYCPRATTGMAELHTVPA